MFCAVEVERRGLSSRATFNSESEEGLPLMISDCFPPQPICGGMPWQIHVRRKRPDSKMENSPVLCQRREGVTPYPLLMSSDLPRTEGSKPMNERLLLFVLAAIQFTTVVDFLIIMPLGPQYMRVFAITPGQFGLIVSAYAISAGICGIASGFFLDRFDRKRALMALYAGFTLGTLFCALAPTYQLLVAARVVAGAFGGVAGALILAIVGDVVPEERRGTAMGLVMSSFSVASICGVPLGLLLASTLTWHVPFFALTGLCLIVWFAAFRVMPSLTGHLHHLEAQHPAECGEP